MTSKLERRDFQKVLNKDIQSVVTDRVHTSEKRPVGVYHAMITATFTGL